MDAKSRKRVRLRNEVLACAKGYRRAQGVRQVHDSERDLLAAVDALDTHERQYGTLDVDQRVT